MTDDVRPVSQAGEDAVLAAIREIIDAHQRDHPRLLLGPGDDAAVLACTSGQQVLTTDTLSAGQDFRPHWWQGRPSAEWPMDIGTKAAAQNLSDLNAMAATPTALLVSLTVPADRTVQWVTDFYAGVLRACSQPGAAHCAVAGGDLGTGPDVSVTITAVGEPQEPGRLLTRTGAGAGEVLAVCGRLGYAAAGLALLEQSGAGPRGSRAVKDQEAEPDQQAGLAAECRAAECRAAECRAAECRAAQLRPQPPLTAGGQALRAGATAGMDLSDGLLRDAARLAEASQVQILLDPTALRDAARELEPVAEHCLGAGPALAWDWVLSGGEDFGLLATFDSAAELPTGFRVIGHLLAVSPGAGPSGSVPGVSVDGVGVPGVSVPGAGASHGWDSLRE
ncbi:thiamine-phosphate kinase [Nesterenkonia sphaerica]|nr:thiamine-phosphate kinase [Nesterenkonia sphaerica]